MFFQQITEPKLSHHAYLIGCQQTGEAIIVDPMRDIDRYLRVAASHGLRIVAAAETHIHADYLTGLRELAEREGARLYVSGAGGDVWKYHWVEGSGYAHELLRDGSHFAIGRIRFDVIHTPGHTPEHIAYLVTDCARDSRRPIGMISGDFVFVGDVGRPDLLESAAGERGAMRPAAATLFDSLQLFRRLAPSLALWPGHGAGSACGRALGSLPSSTVGYEQTTNPSVLAADEKPAFVDYILDSQPEPPPYFARMKRENRDGPALLSDGPGPVALCGDEIGTTTADGVVWIDTRPWEEYRDAHLPGALFATLDREFPTVLGSYVEAGAAIGLIVTAERLDEAVADCIRIGLDRIVGWVAPRDLASYLETAASATTTEVAMSDLGAHLSDAAHLPLDVRPAAEFTRTGGIADAVNCVHVGLAAGCETLPRDRRLYVYCRTGNRSRFAAAYLQRRGFDVINVTGGFAEWQARNGQPQPLSA